MRLAESWEARKCPLELLGRAWCFKEDQGGLGERRRRAPKHGEWSCRWPEGEGRKGLDGIVF